MDPNLSLIFGAVIIILIPPALFLALYLSRTYWRFYRIPEDGWRKEFKRKLSFMFLAFVLAGSIACLMVGGLLLVFQEFTLPRLAAAVSVFSIAYAVYRLPRKEGERFRELRRQWEREEEEWEEALSEREEKIDGLRKRLRQKEEELKGRDKKLEDLSSELGKAREASEGLRRELEETRRKLEEAEALLAELRRALGEGHPSPKHLEGGGTLVQELLRLKAEGWRFKSTRVKGKEYLVARKSVGGEREERSLGRLDGERRKALEAAGITLQGGRA